jgi:hypothetical protein
LGKLLFDLSFVVAFKESPHKIDCASIQASKTLSAKVTAVYFTLPNASVNNLDVLFF